MYRKYYYLFFHYACIWGHVLNVLEWLPVRRDWEWRLAMKREEDEQSKTQECGLALTHGGSAMNRSVYSLLSLILSIPTMSILSA